MTEDKRWQQRFDNYQKVLVQLEKFVAKGNALSEMEGQGLIKSFEYTYELGWLTMKDYLQSLGNIDLFGSRDSIQRGFQRGLIIDGQGWMDMYKDRIKTAHTYKQETAQEVIKAITERYFTLFKDFEKRMLGLAS